MSLHMLSRSFHLTGYSLYTRRSSARQIDVSWKLQGSTNGSTWNDLNVVENIIPPSSNVTHHLLSNQNFDAKPAYSYFRLVVTRLFSNHMSAQCGDLVLFGYSD
jgi:hypothetical protein